jgi:alkanesulfonate monooxygenase SsuD/methylene tetrahydromethanopterin reductase-like flavin-dependent oxidoreductase (luciferase family)
VGNPDQCIEKLSKLQKELEVTEVICRMQFPNMPQEMAMKSIRLLGETVMPQLKD